MPTDRAIAARHPARQANGPSFSLKQPQPADWQAADHRPRTFRSPSGSGDCQSCCGSSANDFSPEDRVRDHRRTGSGQTPQPSRSEVSGRRRPKAAASNLVAPCSWPKLRPTGPRLWFAGYRRLAWTRKSVEYVQGGVSARKVDLPAGSQVSASQLLERFWSRPPSKHSPDQHSSRGAKRRRRYLCSGC